MIDVNIKNLLSTILNESSNLPGVYERRLPTHSTLPVYLGVEMPSSLYKFSFIFDKNFINVLSDDGAEGFLVEITEEPSNSNLRKFTIKLLNSKFSDIFLILCTDLLNILSESHGEERNKLLKLNKRLDYWREFLRRPKNQRLSTESEIGLMGELNFIKILLSSNEKIDLMKFWSGPLGATHDFHNDSVSVEIKTSTVKQRSYVKISSEFQLDIKDGSKLFLSHFEIRETDNKSSSFNLVTLTNDIRKLIDESSFSIFDGLLALVGYMDVDAHYYDKKRYELVKLTSYRVIDGFPRLITEDLNQSLSDIQYRLNLSGLNDFMVSTDDVINDFLGM